MLKRIVGFFLVLIFSIGLLELLSWAAVIVMSSQPDPLKAETHLFDPHRNHRVNPAFQSSDNPKSRIHSADGFRRDEPVVVDKPDNTIRILMMGASGLYGASAGAGYPPHRALYNDETISYFLEKKLQQRLTREGVHKRVEVLNAGVSGYKTFHQIVYLNSDLLKYSPDIVVNFDGHNDFYDINEPDRWNTYSYSTSILTNEFNGRTPFLVAFTLVRALAPYSNFFDLAERAMKRLWYKKIGQPLPHNSVPYTKAYPEDHSDHVREAAAETYLRDIWQIKKMGEYEGYDQVVILQPEILFEDDSSLSSGDQKTKALTVELKGAASAERMNKVRKLLPELFAEKGISYHDLGAIAEYSDVKEDLYIDYCHLTAAGSKVVATELAPIILPMLLERVGVASDHPVE